MRSGASLAGPMVATIFVFGVSIPKISLPKISPPLPAEDVGQRRINLFSSGKETDPQAEVFPTAIALDSNDRATRDEWNGDRNKNGTFLYKRPVNISFYIPPF